MRYGKSVLHGPPDLLSAHHTLLLVLKALEIMHGEHLPCVLDLRLVFGRDLILLREFASPRFGGWFACWWGGLAFSGWLAQSMLVS